MTRDELIEELKRELVELDEDGTAAAEWKAEGVRVALSLAEQLDSPPAMAWQDQPSEHGRHYVEGWELQPILVSQFGNGVWNFVNPFSQAWCSLSGRRVCPIPAPPPLPKRGES